MNFLAHLTLSNDDDDILIGNLIADSARSAEFSRFKAQVVYGIRLHHKIDAFTDQHEIVAQSKERLRPRHGKYAGVVVDIFYDHFLARFYPQYGDRPLPDFAARCYDLLRRRRTELTPAVRRMLPHMVENNWLVSYASEDGMRRVFTGMSHRASFNNHLRSAVDDLMQDYEAYQKEFEAYWPQLEGYVQQVMRELPYP